MISDSIDVHSVTSSEARTDDHRARSVGDMTGTYEAPAESTLSMSGEIIFFPTRSAVPEAIRALPTAPVKGSAFFVTVCATFS